MLANASLPDRILAGLTARQLGLLGAAGAATWALFSALSTHIPVALAAVVCIPLMSAGAALALGQIDGAGLDRIAVLALRYLRRPRLRALVTAQVPSPPPWAHKKAKVAPVEFPIRETLHEGVLDLGDAVSVVCRASPFNLALRSEKEQQAIVDAFGRFLNSLSHEVEILVRSSRPDLTERLKALEQIIAALPHPLLEERGRRHIEFLKVLSARADVVRRDAFLCFRENGASDEARTRLRRHVDEASTLLRPAGVHLSVLSESEVRTLVGSMTDRALYLPRPTSAGRLLPDTLWK